MTLQIFRRTSTGLAPGQIAVGGNHGYIEVLSATGAHIGFLSVPDVGGPLLQYVTGLAFNPLTGDLFATSTAGLTAPDTDDDVAWIPDNSGVLIATVPAVGQLDFHKYDYGGVLLTSWTGIPVEDFWAQEPVHLAVACDGMTVYYTQSFFKVQRFDLTTGLPLTDYEVLTDPMTPYLYGGVAAMPGETGDDQDVVTAMTISGDGPRRCVALASKTQMWVDEVNPGDGVYHIQKRRVSDHVLVQAVATQADPGADNDRTLSLATFFNPCAVRIPRIPHTRVTWIGV